VRTKIFIGEALASIRSNLSTTLAATMTVLIGMFLLGLFITLGTWMLSYTSDLKKQIVVNVYFDRDASVREINAVALHLRSMPEVRSLGFVSKDEALRIMKERYPKLTNTLAANPFPASFKVTPRRAEDKEKVAAAVRDSGWAGVSSVRTGKNKSDRVLQVARIVGVVVLVGAVVLLLASTMLIANTIRLSIFSRRREIEVMKLVGATNWFVRGPFMLEGLLCGCIGSLAAVILLLLGKLIVLPELLKHTDSLSDPAVKALAFPLTALILVGMSLLVGAAGSGVTIRRFLRV
jgi:cell division transport system permease protein